MGQADFDEAAAEARANSAFLQIEKAANNLAKKVHAIELATGLSLQVSISGGHVETSFTDPNEPIHVSMWGGSSPIKEG